MEWRIIAPFEILPSSQPHVMELTGELGLETYREYCEGKKVMQLGDDKIRTYQGDIPALPWYCLIDLHLFIIKVCDSFPVWSMCLTGFILIPTN